MEQKYDLLKVMKTGILRWYDFKDGAKVLYIGRTDDGLADWLQGKNLEVTVDGKREYRDESFLCGHKAEYDYIVAVEEIEKGFSPQEKLCCMRELLREDGILLLGANNRLGIRYFCGDKDNYSGNCFDGIDNYRLLTQREREALEGKNYSKAELKKLLKTAGWSHLKFYSVFPNLEVPQHIFSEDYVPNEELGVRLFPSYENSESVFMQEEYLYTDLLENGLFHTLANGFLIECSNGEAHTNVNQVTLALDRTGEDAQMTIVRSDGMVEKAAVYEEGRRKYQMMRGNAEDLRRHGIQVLDADIVDGKYVMKYIDCDNAEIYFRRLAYEGDTDRFIMEMDRFRETILHSSEWVEENENGVILKKGYTDMMPLNCFVIDGEFVFYDQEFYENNYPANAIIYRMVETVYCFDENLNQKFPNKFFYERYGLMDKLEMWRKMSISFSSKLKNDDLLAEYRALHRTKGGRILQNRYKINISTGKKDYDMYFGLFSDVENKKIFLFGTGRYAESYLTRYGKLYPPTAYIDNSEQKQGTVLHGKRIYDADYLLNFPQGEIEVIVCIREYDEIVEQLKNMNIKNIRIYNPRIDYLS